MNNYFLRLALLASLATTVGLSAEEPAKTSAADPTTMIVDLRANPPGIFQYGTWNGKLAAAKSGLAVLGAKGALGDGGMGQDLPAPVDYRVYKYFEVALGVVPGNEVPYVTIAFNDADGTQFTARVLIEQLVPGQPVWLRVKQEDFRLNIRESGSDPNMDWSKITRWHLQGDWNTKKPMQVIFIALRGRT